MSNIVDYYPIYIFLITQVIFFSLFYRKLYKISYNDKDKNDKTDTKIILILFIFIIVFLTYETSSYLKISIDQSLYNQRVNDFKEKGYHVIIEGEEYTCNIENSLIFIDKNGMETKDKKEEKILMCI